MSHRQNFSTPFVATCFCDFIPVAFPNIARGRQSNPLGTQMLIAYSPARYIILGQQQWCLWKRVVFILHPRWGKSLELLLSSYLIWVFFSNYDIHQMFHYVLHRMHGVSWGIQNMIMGGSMPQRVGTFASCFLDKLFPFGTTCFKFLICFVNKLQFVMVSHHLPGCDSCGHWCVVNHSVAKIFYFLDIPSSAESWTTCVQWEHIQHRLQHLQQSNDSCVK